MSISRENRRVYRTRESRGNWIRTAKVVAGANELDIEYKLKERARVLSEERNHADRLRGRRSSRAADAHAQT